MLVCIQNYIYVRTVITVLEGLNTLMNSFVEIIAVPTVLSELGQKVARATY
jgi:hypothetical protein